MRPLQLITCRGMQAGAISQWQTNTYLAIFYFLRAERVTRQCHPLLQHVAHRFMLPVHCWKHSLQLGTCIGDAKGSILPLVNKDLFAELYFLMNGEGDKATTTSFTICCVLIHASSVLLEGLITTQYMQEGCKRRHFTHGKQILAF